MKKYLYIAMIIIALLCIHRAYFSEHIGWGEDSKPHTDNFLELLTDENYEGLSEKYGSGMSPDALKKKFDRFHSLFGRIISYRYKRASASYDSRSGNLMGFSVSYQIDFDSAKNCRGVFGIKRLIGSDQAKCLILKELFVNFGLKQCLYRPFRGQKERYRKNSESYNALFDAEKCDIGPENAYFGACFAYFSIS